MVVIQLLILLRLLLAAVSGVIEELLAEVQVVLVRVVVRLDTPAVTVELLDLKHQRAVVAVRLVTVVLAVRVLVETTLVVHAVQAAVLQAVLAAQLHEPVEV
jgi:hypothetical protein